ncbi:hypothetical protein BKA65DRAFT_598494 [Rhexocercosporidium sp. MPI-PUGE-AT-0058]|nr:hypothetical protein BKA65DRAFT_598494 [Rhexocercosporidium sp. MPI-PUGE-AT-0058]
MTDFDFDTDELEADFRRIRKLKGSSNYLIWRRNIISILEYYQVEACIQPDEFFDHEEVNDEDLSYMSTLIQSTFSSRLDFCIWSELDINSRKLWQELDDRFQPKGKWACIMHTIQLNRMRPEHLANDNLYCSKERLIASQRNETGVKVTREIENMVGIVESLPEYLNYLQLQWCVAKEDELTAAKMQEKVLEADKFYNSPEEKELRARMCLTPRKDEIQLEIAEVVGTL